jgi:hypothetical protein
MAVIKSDKLGTLNINLNQGDNKSVSLVFKDKDVLGVLTPIDLTQYSSIKMDIKKRVNVNESPFISWSIGDGLTISGDNNEILNFEFAQEFYASQLTQWVYDLKFIKAAKVSHMINGVININLVTTL